MKKRKNKKNSKAAEKALKVTINGKEETVYEQETPETEANKSMTFSNWEEKKTGRTRGCGIPGTP